MSYDYSPNEVLEIANRVYDRNLSCPAQFFTTPGWKLRAVYNGIGPEAWSSRFRKLVTKLLEKVYRPRHGARLGVHILSQELLVLHRGKYAFCGNQFHRRLL